MKKARCIIGIVLFFAVVFSGCAVVVVPADYNYPDKKKSSTADVKVTPPPKTAVTPPKTHTNPRKSPDAVTVKAPAGLTIPAGAKYTSQGTCPVKFYVIGTLKQKVNNKDRNVLYVAFKNAGSRPLKHIQVKIATTKGLQQSPALVKIGPNQQQIAKFYMEPDREMKTFNIMRILFNQAPYRWPQMVINLTRGQLGGLTWQPSGLEGIEYAFLRFQNYPKELMLWGSGTSRAFVFALRNTTNKNVSQLRGKVMYVDTKGREKSSTWGFADSEVVIGPKEAKAVVIPRPLSLIKESAKGTLVLDSARGFKKSAASPKPKMKDTKKPPKSKVVPRKTPPGQDKDKIKKEKEEKAKKEKAEKEKKAKEAKAKKDKAEKEKKDKKDKEDKAKKEKAEKEKKVKKERAEKEKKEKKAKEEEAKSNTPRSQPKVKDTPKPDKPKPEPKVKDTPKPKVKETSKADKPKPKAKETPKTDKPKPKMKDTPKPKAKETPKADKPKTKDVPKPKKDDPAPASNLNVKVEFGNFMKAVGALPSKGKNATPEQEMKWQKARMTVVPTAEAFLKNFPKAAQRVFIYKFLMSALDGNNVHAKVVFYSDLYQKEPKPVPNMQAEFVEMKVRALVDIGKMAEAKNALKELIALKKTSNMAHSLVPMAEKYLNDAAAAEDGKAKDTKAEGKKEEKKESKEKKEKKSSEEKSEDNDDENDDNDEDEDDKDKEKSKGKGKKK